MYMYNVHVGSHMSHTHTYVHIVGDAAVLKKLQLALRRCSWSWWLTCSANDSAEGVEDGGILSGVELGHMEHKRSLGEEGREERWKEGERGREGEGGEMEGGREREEG